MNNDIEHADDIAAFEWERAESLRIARLEQAQERKSSLASVFGEFRDIFGGLEE
jgi:hypothetical protein